MIRTVTLTRGALEETVSVTGTVESTGVTNVTTTQAGAVTKIYVTAGNAATEGQELCLLDSDALTEQLEKARKTYSDNVASAQENYDKALETRTTAYDTSVAAESAVTTSKAALSNPTARLSPSTPRASIPIWSMRTILSCSLDVLSPMKTARRSDVLPSSAMCSARRCSAASIR